MMGRKITCLPMLLDGYSWALNPYSHTYFRNIWDLRKNVYQDGVIYSRRIGFAATSFVATNNVVYSVFENDYRIEKIAHVNSEQEAVDLLATLLYLGEL